MERRYLGSSGLQVSALALGTATFGGRGKFAALGGLDLPEARRLVDIAIDAGVNLFDTSSTYSEGLAEEILAEALGPRRDRVLVETKLRFSTGPDSNDNGLSRHHILDTVEASLRRLRRDHIDILILHGIDPATPLEETLRALEDLVRSGKVRYLGLSNFSAWMIVKALAIADARGWDRIVVHQAYYSLIGRDLENELIPCAEEEGFGHMVWSPLAGGLLSGKYQRAAPQPSDSRYARGFAEMPPHDEQQALEVIEVAAEIAADRRASVAQVALNWLRARPTIASVVIGARHEEQLVDNLAAMSWELSAAELEALDEVSAVPAPYPRWYQAEKATERAVGPGRVAL